MQRYLINIHKQFIKVAVESQRADQVTIYNGTELVGEKVPIGCFFSTKPPGQARWELNRIRYTQECDLQINDGTLNKSDTCISSSNNANYTFWINSLDFNRDHGSNWECVLAERDPLTVNVASKFKKFKTLTASA